MNDTSRLKMLNAYLKQLQHQQRELNFELDRAQADRKATIERMANECK